MAQVTASIKQGATVQGAVVHIDDINVTSTGQKPITLNSGGHKLHWWFAGNVGDELDIAVTPVGGGKPLVSVSDQIAPGFAVEAGDKAFTI
jgi:hypothetical protein